jgi:hypothetical protein
MRVCKPANKGRTAEMASNGRIAGRKLRRSLNSKVI